MGPVISKEARLVNMRLLDTTTFQLREFSDTELPSYAILSHTWREEEVTFADLAILSRTWREEEVPFADLATGRAINDSNFDKIRQTCEQAKRDCYRYVWIDTCCIDKSSSAELSEAINSMYSWYARAAVCYVYLLDISATGDPDYANFKSGKSRWFTRGWTLQELLAPSNVIFFSREWIKIGSKNSLRDRVSETTGIDTDILQGNLRLGSLSIAQRMSWVSTISHCRNTSLRFHEDIVSVLERPT